jgi:DNA modification methylase
MKQRIIQYGLGDDPTEGTLLYGQNVLDTLKDLPEGSVQMAATSPPYWGLRDYGGEPQVWGGDSECEHQWGDPDRRNPVPPAKRQCSGCGRFGTTDWATDSETTTVCSHCKIETEHDDVETRGIQIGVKDTGNTENWTTRTSQIPYTGGCGLCDAWKGHLGLEPTPDLFVAHLVIIFREVRRVLRDDGVLWLNLGDSYNNRSVARPSSHQGGLGFDNDSISTSWSDHTKSGLTRGSLTTGGLKEKDMVGIPWMVAFALRADGWYLRSDIIWSKPSCMPSSVRDRPTKNHEYVFLLTKSPRYFYDHNAIREPLAGERHAPGNKGRKGVLMQERWNQGVSTDPSADPDRVWGNAGGRSKRTVWTINPKPYKGAHFATWPEALVEPMVKAGSSAYGCCSECRAPYVRRVERTVPVDAGRSDESQYMKGKDGIIGRAHDAHRLLGQAYQNQLDANPLKTVGWDATCECDADVVPCTVLDPFSGSATTGAVAMRLGRNYIGCDLQGDYIDLAEARLQGRKAPSKGEPESDLISDLFG